MNEHAQLMWEMFNAGSMFGFMTGASISLICVWFQDYQQFRKEAQK